MYSRTNFYNGLAVNLIEQSRCLPQRRCRRVSRLPESIAANSYQHKQFVTCVTRNDGSAAVFCKATRYLLCQPEKREHPAGFSFLSAIGIIASDVARGADARVMNLCYASGAALLNDLRGKIDFVMRRSNTRTELHHQLSRVRSEMFPHLLNRIGNNRRLGPILAGMNQANRRCFWIDNVNRAAIGNMNTKCDLFLIGDDPVATGEFFIARGGLID